MTHNPKCIGSVLQDMKVKRALHPPYSMKTCTIWLTSWIKSAEIEITKITKEFIRIDWSEMSFILSSIIKNSFKQLKRCKEFKIRL